MSDEKEKPILWIGEPVKPQPPSEEYIKAIENAGARPDFVESLRKDRARWEKQQSEKLRKTLNELTERNTYASAWLEEQKKQRAREDRIIKGMGLVLFIALFSIITLTLTCQSNTEQETSSPTMETSPTE